jgi:hypothetical protein
MKYILIIIISFITYFTNIISYNNIFYIKNNIFIKSKLCRLCYIKPIIRNNLKLFNIYNNYIYINELNNTKCIIFYNNTSIDICFKGTTNIANVCSNIQILLKSYNNIKVHNGFLNQYLILKNKLFNNIDNIIKNNNISEISLSGHSSGGAIANIASIDFCKKYNDISIKCVTFGSPKVGNKNFVDEYNKYVKDSYRIVNKNDIIEYFPLPIIYKHIHKPIYLEENKNYKIYNYFLNVYQYIKHKHNIITYINNLIV